jgi:hypothetical protein
LMKQYLPQNLCITATAALAFGLLLTPVTALGQSTAAPAAGQYEGVAHPPPDDTIEASPDAPPPAAAPAPAKPLPGVPAGETAPTPSKTVATPLAAATTGNPDDGVVGDAVPGSSAAAGVSAPAAHDAHLIPRAPENPDFGVVSLVPSPSNQLAEGTNIRVRLMQNLSTRSTQDGTPFRGQVAADVYKEGRVVIPVGSELRGQVVSVTQGHRFGTPATLRLRPEAVLLPDGTSYHLYAQAVHSDAPGTRTDAEGGIQPSSRVVKNLVQYGAGTGGGAATGGLLGGPAGAAAGAIVGASLVTTHLILQHPGQAVVEQGSEVTFSLTEPMDLVATRN